MLHYKEFRDRDPKDELIEKKREQALKTKRRQATLQLARQRDSKLAARLIEKWREEDEKAKAETRRRLIELVCQSCEKPFATPLKPRRRILCFTCKKFFRQKKTRDYYHSHPELKEYFRLKRREYRAKAKLAKQQPLSTRSQSQQQRNLPTPITIKQHQPNSDATSQRTSSSNTTVVWSPDI